MERFDLKNLTRCLRHAVTVYEKNKARFLFFGRCLHLYSAFILVCVRNAESQYGTPFFASGRQALISGLINETRPPTTFFPYILGIHLQRLTYAIGGIVLFINPEMRACFPDAKKGVPYFEKVCCL